MSMRRSTIQEEFSSEVMSSQSFQREDIYNPYAKKKHDHSVAKSIDQPVKRLNFKELSDRLDKYEEHKNEHHRIMAKYHDHQNTFRPYLHKTVLKPRKDNFMRKCDHGHGEGGSKTLPVSSGTIDYNKEN